MSRVPATKTVELVSELNVLSGMDPIDEFRLHRVYAEAQKLPSHADKHMISGICFCLKNDPRQAFENLDSALRLSREINVINAYFKASLRMNLEQKAYLLATEASQIVFPPETAVNAIRVMVNCGDFKGASEALDLHLQAYSNQPEKIEFIEQHSAVSVDTVRALSRLDFDYPSLAVITRKIMEFAYESCGYPLTDKVVEFVEDDVDVISNHMFFAGAPKETLKKIDEFIMDQLISMEPYTNTLKYVFHVSSDIKQMESGRLASVS